MLQDNVFEIDVDNSAQTGVLGFGCLFCVIFSVLVIHLRGKEADTGEGRRRSSLFTPRAHRNRGLKASQTLTPCLPCVGKNLVTCIVATGTREAKQEKGAQRQTQ